jgi:type VI secretion system secreted protein Hcp
MAYDAFLKIDGIKGESKDRSHPDEIEVFSFSWGATQSGTLAAGGGGGTGKASFQDLHFTSTVHKGSPSLFLYCATGKHIKQATITLRKAAAQGFEFLKLTLSDVVVSSYQPAFSTEDTPSEEVSLNFAKIEFDYVLQSPDGSPGEVFPASFDVLQNRAG